MGPNRWSSELPTRKDNAGRWHAEACVGRRRLHRRLAPGATEGDAKRVAAALLTELHAAQAAANRPTDPLLTDLLADYTQRHALTLRSPATAQYHALRIGRWCAGKRASDTRAVVAKIVQDLSGHYAPATINRSLGALRKALAIAWERGTTSADYSTLVKHLPEHNARTTWLTLGEVQAIADKASPACAAAIWLSVLTGCRRGEVLAITQAMIGPGTITLPAGATKTERARSVPIIAPARPWLEHVPIPLTFEGLKSGFRRARVAAGRPDVQFRDLRRSCGTLLIQLGAPLHIVSKILGHSSTTVTERVYAHLAPQQLHDVLAGLEPLHQDLHLSSAAPKKSAVSR